MKGILYAVGVGPGDPDLLTVKAIKTISMPDEKVYYGVQSMPDEAGYFCTVIVK